VRCHHPHHRLLVLVRVLIRVLAPPPMETALVLVLVCLRGPWVECGV